MERNEQLAWAAGFFDGEGCFTASPGQANRQGVQRRYLKLQVAQKNPELLYKFKDIFGYGEVYRYVRKSNGEPMHTYALGNVERVVGAASELWPYLGEQKKADFKRCLRLVAESRIAADQAMEVASRVCAAPDCTTEFVPDVRHRQSAYCSTTCYQRVRARWMRGPLKPRLCSGCGCHVDERTRGCRRCMTRHWNRRQGAAKGGGLSGEISL